ncbi:hypothetical protein Ddye_024952 [Dipteronia dyeriana]|uniref:Malectin-like domain-containing protein n=1 Tax=Dipteronia dyeriana TaxID=168575 RepID=A0AAD9TWU5_9ROSI|nr:hypothetical protein Ddye_024952 [Dipteronia dyeriana]
MDHWRLFLSLLYLSALHFLPSSCYRTIGYSRLLIDCGSSNETTTKDRDSITDTWRTDEEFIKSGKNILIAPNQNFNVMNTLRSFPDGNKNCYKLPLNSDDIKYLLRAGFFYGNYDGQSRPPSFKLEIDGNLWANVTTSMSQEDPVYHELVYRVKQDQATLCLVRTSNDEVPFISSIEAVEMDDSNIYRLMENKTALYLHSRINYGANKSVEKLIGRMEEEYDRIWESKEMSEYLNVTAEVIPNDSLLGENDPPWPVMATAIRAKNISDSIYLTVNFSSAQKTQVVAYFVLYFMDPTFFYPPNQTNKVDIYIDSQKLNTTDIPLFGRYDNAYSVVSLYPVRVFGSANVTISSTGNSTLAPVLNAMEVFSVMDVSKGGHMMIGFSIAFYAVLLHICFTILFFY